jgi:hypothetical protein
MQNFHYEHFWNQFHLENEQIGHWKMGPLSLWVKRFTHEWRIWYYYETKERQEHHYHYELPCNSSSLPPDNAEVRRFGVHHTNSALIFTPVLPDKPIVARPEIPFYILPQEEVHVFVGIPLWIRIETKDRTTLAEIPVYRLSKTWFGDPAAEGELCYFTAISSRLNLKEITEKYHRAISTILIQNQSRQNLLLERVKLPTLHLALFKNQRQLFYTQSLVIECEKGGDMAQLRLNHTPPEDVGKTETIFPARAPLKENIITKTLNHFF